ncbi:MAG: two-component system chemotaxis response regulator CheY [Candidatus Latescibacterota bacterium]|jgi:two-component system chemotaxis response regulator CheY
MALKVLLVEDTVGIPMSKVLKKWGYEVSLAVDGEDAWKQISEKSFDCFLIDWMLPGISGIDLIQKLRQTPHCKDKAIVMISGRSGKEDIAMAAASGIDSYLAKPFTALQLRDKVEEVVAARAVKQTNTSQRIERIIQGHARFFKADETPYIIFGEPANTTTELQHRHTRHVVDYLGGAIDAIDKANQEHENLSLGYVIATKADEIVEHVKSLVTRERICAILLSTDFKGNALRLTRLLSANRSRFGFAVILVCNTPTDIPFGQQADLEELSVRIYQRAEFNEQTWQHLIEEYVVPDEDI